jgi:hypothetical protein
MGIVSEEHDGRSFDPVAGMGKLLQPPQPWTFTPPALAAPMNNA